MIYKFPFFPIPEEGGGARGVQGPLQSYWSTLAGSLLFDLMTEIQQQPKKKKRQSTHSGCTSACSDVYNSRSVAPRPGSTADATTAVAAVAAVSAAGCHSSDGDDFGVSIRRHVPI